MLTLLWGVIFGILSIFTLCSENMALQTEPTSYSVFFLSASMVIPTVCGIILWKEPFTPGVATGLLLFLISFYLIVTAGGKDSKKVNVRWTLFCFSVWLHSNCSSLVTEHHQTVMQSRESAALMMIGFASAALTAFLASCVIKAYHESGKIKNGSENSIYSTVYGTAACNRNRQRRGQSFINISCRGCGCAPSVSVPAGRHDSTTTIYCAVFEKLKRSMLGKIGLIIGIGAIIAINS